MKRIAILSIVFILIATFAIVINNSELRESVLGTSTGPADSSWPTFHGDNQRTGLSPYDTSNVDGRVLWTFETGSGIEASPTIGEDGTIYFGAMDGYVYAVNPDGTLKWKTKIGTPQIKGYGGDSHLSSVTSTPAIDKQGNVYVTSRDQYIFALDSEGKIKWKFQINLTPDHWGSPLIGDDGTIYVNGSPPDENFYEVDETVYIRENPPEGGLYALNPDGTERWHYPVKFRMFNSPTMDKDGTIYIAVLTDYYKNNLIAFNQDGTVKWDVPLPMPVESSPTVVDNGVVYLGSFMQSGDGAGLFAVTKDGVQWHHVVGGKEVLSTPAVAPDGTIHIGSMTSKVFAINPDGTRKWEFDTEGNTVESSSAIGADGTIYFGGNPTGSGKPNFFALNTDGTVKWKFATELHASIMASPAIGADGTVYITAFDGNLYAFGGPEKETISAGLKQAIPDSISSKSFPTPIVVASLAVLIIVGGSIVLLRKSKMKKMWLILIPLFLIALIAIGLFLKRSSGVQPLTNFYKKGPTGNTCLTNEEYGEVTDPDAPVLSIPFDLDNYSTKHWGIVPFCAKLRGGNVHGGLDFELKPDSKVYSAADGVVEKAYVGKEEGSGEIISVVGDGFTLGYSGLTNLQVEVGDKIKRGDYIANAVLIPHGEHHVHLGLTINKKEECPIKYMDEEFLQAFKQMFAQASYGSQTDAPCACNCESFTPNY